MTGRRSAAQAKLPGPRLPGRRRTPLLSLALDRAAPVSLQQQLYDQVREVILAGGLAPGSRLPSSRALAGELACSRNTVVSAFDQLLSEGYLEGHAGSGTFVSRVLPEDLLGLAPSGAATKQVPCEAPPVDPLTLLSPRGRALTGLRRTSSGPLRAFLPGAPETGEFPFDVWARLHSRIWRHPRAALARHGAPAGQQVLREAIARYLATFRGLTCDWRQVIITSGAQQSLDLMVQLLLQPGDQAWVEDPGYPGLRGPLIAAGVTPVPVPLDGEGILVAEGRRRAAKARAAIVTPTHHYPLGTPMSLARRLELLEWARDSGSWILEDDYDSEYRYAGRPLASLLSLASERRGSGDAVRVIYIGSFSKVLFPSIRLGYLVVPQSLVDAVSDAQNALGAQPTAVIQPVLAAFIEEGHFATHVRRMRRLYAARQAALLAAAERHLCEFLEVSPDDAGLHLVAWLKPNLAKRLGDRGAAAVAEAAGISLAPLSDYYAKEQGEGPPAKGEARRQGLLMGYAAIPEQEIERGARRLAAAFRNAL